MVNISNCPISGLERKITHKDLFIYENRECVILDCYISHFKDGERIELAAIKSYIKQLNANNSVIVNKQTGVSATEEDIANDMTCGQYDFFKYIVENVPVVINTMILSYIDSNDIKGSFNI
jgi:hypothetical protein